MRGGQTVLIACRDPGVRQFVEREMVMSPYAVPQFTKTADQVFEAACKRFGRRCDDVEFWVH